MTYFQLISIFAYPMDHFFSRQTSSLESKGDILLNSRSDELIIRVLKYHPDPRTNLVDCLATQHRTFYNDLTCIGSQQPTKQFS
ncbi:hypothetical protein D3C76_1578560 [compost metagenome]